MTRGRKPKPADGNHKVVAGPFPDLGVEIAEPDWLVSFSASEWATRAAALAREKWAEVVAHMTTARTLGPENASAIEILAVNYARWRLAEAHVGQHGPIVPAPRTGVPMHNPYLSVANAAVAIILKIEAELGLPPSMRSRVGKLAPKRTAPRASDSYLKPGSA